MQDKSMQDILSNFLKAGRLEETNVTECGMSEDGMESGVTLKTSSASEMAEILRALAGVENKPAMPPMDAPMDAPMDMPIKMKLPMDGPEEAEMEDYDNEPEEEYMDMDDVLPSGDDLHRKKDLKAMRVKDPAVETASIKDRLWAALNEKKSTCSECGKPSYTTLPEEKQKGVDGKVCWKGYKRMGTKMKGGKRVDNCVKM
jgi:hypothetical protein